MRILFIITRSDVMGGASVHLLDLACGLKSNGHSVHILVGGEGVLHERAHAVGLTIQTIPSLVRQISPVNDLKAFKEIRDAIKSCSPDLVHLHSSKAGLLGRFAAKSLGIPCVFTAHGWAFTDGVSKTKRCVYKVLEKLAAKCSDKIIAVSDYDRDLALKNNVVLASDIVTIHNGVPDNFRSFGGVTKAQSELVKFIMVARFEQPKDQLRVLNVFSKLKGLPWSLQFVGDGPALNDAKILCQKLDLNECVTFSGACNDVPSRLADSDVFILLSNWEGLPLTILEAMSFGLPIVASDVGGVKETVDDSCGYLIGRNDEALLEEKLLGLISSSSLRSSMGAAARVRYEEKFTLTKMIEQTAIIYDEVLR